MEEKTLVDLGSGLDIATVASRNIDVTLPNGRANNALRLASSPGHDWAGITFEAPGGSWDLSLYEHVALDVRNAGPNAVSVHCRVDNPGADGTEHCNTGSVFLAAGENGTLVVNFKRGPAGEPDIELFGMRGYPVPQQDSGTIDPSAVTKLLVFLANPTEDHVFEIANVRAGGEYRFSDVPGPGEFFPFIDEFGQYIHKDWPGKMHSLAELAAQIESESAELARKPGPEGWNEYGGWEAGPALEATGFFRTQKHAGKWWMVDPKGRLFFSHGIDCLNARGSTPIEKRGNWFRDLPGDDSEFKEFYGSEWVLHGHYKDRTVKCFDFVRANLLQKFGEDWWQRSADLAHARLRSWGLNTIANWSDEGIYLQRQTPYCVAVRFGGKLLEGSEGYWGKFRDVFDPDFERQLELSMAAQAGTSAGDPWCLGYFVDNEIAWGDDVSLAIAALLSPPEQKAKQVFVEDLEVKYGTVERLNAAWGTSHGSWGDLLEHRESPDSEKARDDLTAFYTKTAEIYFEKCRAAVKRIAPDNLYLGCRLAWVNDLAAKAAAKYCDVVSYNIYKRSVAEFEFPGGSDVPLLIGEFHFGALDRGMFHTGLVPVADQAERAKAYQEYVRGLLRHPQFVGCHWFQYRDEPTTGRAYDAENYQIGFVDVADTPYPETIQASREIGHSLYTYRLGARD